MVHKLFTPAHHPALLHLFTLRIYAYYVFALAITPTVIKTQDITGLEVIRTLTHQNHFISAIDCYFMGGYELIAYGNSSGGTGGDTLVIYDFEQDNSLAEIPGSWFSYTVSFVNHDQLLYSNNDTLFRVVDFEFPSVISIRDDHVTTFALSPDKTTIAILGQSGDDWDVDIASYSQSTGLITPIENFPIPEPFDNQGTSLTFSPDGDILAINGGYEKNYVYFININTGNVLGVNTPDNQGTYSPVFYSQNNTLRLAVGGGYANGGIEVIDVDQHQVEASVPVFPHYNFALAFDPTQSYNVCGGYDGLLKLFGVEGTDFTEIKSYSPGAISRLMFTQDNQYVLTGMDSGNENSLLIYRILRESSSVGTPLVKEMRLYPNPTMNKLQIEEIPDAMISIHDSSGRLVLKLKSTASPIDVSALENGIYMIKAMGKKEIFTGRFVKS